MEDLHVSVTQTPNYDDLQIQWGFQVHNFGSGVPLPNLHSETLPIIQYSRLGVFFLIDGLLFLGFLSGAGVLLCRCSVVRHLDLLLGVVCDIDGHGTKTSMTRRPPPRPSPHLEEESTVLKRSLIYFDYLRPGL